MSIKVIPNETVFVLIRLSATGILHAQLGTSLGCNQITVGMAVYTTGQTWDGYPTQDAAPVQCIDAVDGGSIAGQEFFPLGGEPSSGFAFAVLDNGVESNQDFISGYSVAIGPYEAYLATLFGTPCCSAGEQAFLPSAVQNNAVTGEFSACFSVDPCSSGMPLDGDFLLTDTGQMYLNWTADETMNGVGLNVTEFDGFTPLPGARPYRGDIPGQASLLLLGSADEAITPLAEERPSRGDIPEPASLLLLGSVACVLATKRPSIYIGEMGTLKQGKYRLETDEIWGGVARPVVVS